MKNLFSQQQDGFQSLNDRKTSALERIELHLQRIADELTTMNKRNYWTIDGLVARDIAADMNAAIDQQAIEQPKSVSELPVEQWSEEQKESVRWQLRNRLKGYRIQENDVLSRWIRWNWNRYCDLDAAYRSKKIKRKVTMSAWAQEIGLYNSKGNTNYRRDLVYPGILTTEQYDNLKKVEA